jgi:hypothetical protein
VEQGKQQIGLLGEMMLKNAEVVIGPNGENLTEIVRVLLDMAEMEDAAAKAAGE